MKRSIVITLLSVVAVFAVTLSACTTDPETNDTDTDANNLFIGNWIAITGTDSNGSIGQRLDTTYSAITFSFTRPDNFQIVADSDNENVLDGSTSGTFSSNSDTQVVDFSVAGGTTISGDYLFTGNEDLTLTLEATTTLVLNGLLGTPFFGELVIDLKLQ